jgi:RNA polymerase sigma-70 factor (ECF subfamily)
MMRLVAFALGAAMDIAAHAQEVRGTVFEIVNPAAPRAPTRSDASRSQSRRAISDTAFVTGSARYKRAGNSAKMPLVEGTAQPQQVAAGSPGTLGAVLYADQSKARETEQAWLRLVRAVAAGDPLALHALYERAHRPVFTLIMRISASREIAEDLTLEVFHDVWRRARDYDPARVTVLGWIMNQARYRAIDSLPASGPARTVTVLESQSRALALALGLLRSDERQAIEGAFFAGLTAAEASARLDQPLGITKSRFRSGLHKLRLAMAQGSAQAVGAAWERNACPQSELTCAHALQALPHGMIAAAEAHIASCPPCERELESLRPIVDAMHSWPADLLRPSLSLKERLARRLAAETGGEPVFPATAQWLEPAWEEVAPGICVKLLASDVEAHRVTMLVRLAPNVSYPAHTHAGVEELHLLNGELWIDERKLFAGDYNLGEAGEGDERVWSETGCACVLMTSTRDILR